MHAVVVYIAGAAVFIGAVVFISGAVVYYCWCCCVLLLVLLCIVADAILILCHYCHCYLFIAIVAAPFKMGLLNLRCFLPLSLSPCRERERELHLAEPFVRFGSWKASRLS